MSSTSAPPQALFHLDRARELPENIRFGTSSWNYEGWKGLIYHREYCSEKALTESALEEYAQFPWFRTVGVDSFYYAPPRVSTLQRYHSQLPNGFRFVSKVWDELSIQRFPNHSRYGKRAGQLNENFLNPDVFLERVLPPYADANCLERVGPFVFQFSEMEFESATERDEFLNVLSTFLGALPKEFQYATEIRNPELLTPQYFQTLNQHGATHCFNHWTKMPTLREQMVKAAEAGGLIAPFYVSRILTPLGVAYQQAVRTFSPYSSIKRPNMQMRNDVLKLARRAIERAVPAYILVNNRSEGCAPLTIDAIGTAIVNELASSQSKGE